MAYDPEEDWFNPDAGKKLSKSLDKYRTPLKIVGLFALVVAAILYGQNQYIAGRADQCIDMDGFLFYDEDYLCKQEPWLSENGLILDKQRKQLKRQIRPLETNISDFNWSSIYINLTELGLEGNESG
jgi:hypothetical protein